MPTKASQLWTLWSPHRDLVHKLYIVDGKSQDYVRRYFARFPYHLDVTKAEFEIVLKVLKISKNLRAADWLIIKHHEARRRRDGKKTDVYFNGVLISQKKVRKETLRYRDNLIPTSGADSPMLPTAVILKTPPPSPSPSDARSMYDDSSANTHIPVSTTALSESQTTCPSDNASLDRLIRSYFHGISRPGSCQTEMQHQWTAQLSTHFPVPPSPVFRYLDLLKEMPTENLNDWLQSRLSLTSHLGHPAYSWHMRAFVSQAIGSPLLVGLDVNQIHSHGQVVWRLRSLIPEMFPCEIERKVIDLNDPELRHIRMTEIMLYMLTNSVNSFEASKKLMDWMITEQPIPLLKLIFAKQDPAAIAVISRLLSLAIVTHANLPFLQFLLDAGLDKKYISGRKGGQLLRLHLLTHSHKGPSPRLCHMLVDAGASIETVPGYSVLHMVAAAYDDYDLIVALLRKGLTIDLLEERELNFETHQTTPLVLAVFNWRSNSIRALLDHGADSKYLDTFSGDRFDRVAFNRLVHTGSDIDTVQFLSSRFGFRWKWLIRYNIILAAREGVTALQKVIHTVQLSDDDLKDMLGKSLDHILHSLLFQSITPQNLVVWNCAISTLLDILWHTKGLHFNISRELLDSMFIFQAYNVINSFIDHGLFLTEAHDVSYMLSRNLNTDWVIGHLTTFFDKLSMIDINTMLPNGANFLQLASSTGNLEVVKFLLNKGAVVNCQMSELKMTALHYAVREGHSEVARLLINMGARINCWPETPAYSLLELCAGIFPDSEDSNQILEIQGLWRLLLSSGAELQSNSLTNSLDRWWGASLVYLILHGVLGNDCIQDAIVAGADIHTRATTRPSYFTPLQAAATKMDIRIARQLISYGARVNDPAEGFAGRTALQAACCDRGSSNEEAVMEMVNILLASGADVNAPPAEENGVTALQGAVASGNVELVLLLLESGAHVEADGAKKDGNTALELAARYGRLDIAQILLNAYRAKGIKANCSTARNLAERQAHFGVVELLDGYIRSG